MREFINGTHDKDDRKLMVQVQVITRKINTLDGMRVQPEHVEKLVQQHGLKDVPYPVRISR